MRRWWGRVTLIGGLAALAVVPVHAGRGAAPAGGARVTVLAHGFGQPDDLAWGPGGSIYFSDFGNSAVNLLTPDGRRSVVLAGLDKPEGLVVENDGSLVVAEQGTNHLLRVDPARHRARIWVRVANPSGRAGIDGIARDPRDGSLIVPDSPSGRVLRVNPAGAITVLARGLGRPVGALVQADGSVIVVDETLKAAFRIDPAGSIRPVGGYLSVPDDLIGDGHGGFYVTCLGDNTLRHVDPDGLTTLVAAGLPNPQGLLRRSDGVLIVAEESANMIVAVRP